MVMRLDIGIRESWNSDRDVKARAASLRDSAGHRCINMAASAMSLREESRAEKELGFAFDYIIAARNRSTMPDAGGFAADDARK